MAKQTPTYKLINLARRVVSVARRGGLMMRPKNQAGQATKQTGRTRMSDDDEGERPIDPRAIPLGRAYQLAKDIVFYGHDYELKTLKEMASEIMQSIKHAAISTGIRTEDISDLDRLLPWLEKSGEYREYPRKR